MVGADPVSALRHSHNGNPQIKGYTEGMNFKVILEPSEDGGFTATIPALPGCISEGDTVEEAMANIKEALQLYLEPVDDDLVPTGGALVKVLTL